MQAAVCKKYQEINNAAQVARFFSLGATTVHRILERHGINKLARGSESLNAAKSNVPAEKQALIVEMYLAGVTLRKICAELSVGQHAIRGACRRAGINMRKRGGQPKQIGDETIAAILEMTRCGMTQEKIAARFGVHQTKISRIQIKNGLKTRRLGDRHGSWKGGKARLGSGYMGILVDASDPFLAMANSCGYVPEHRYVMANSLGRVLSRDETVHHINGDKTDNRIENLQLRQGKHGKGVVMCCAACGSTNIVSKELS